MTTYSLVDAKAKGHEFVNGNTKFLKEMNQADLKVLFTNGDRRVKATEASAEEKRPPRSAAPVVEPGSTSIPNV